MANPNPPVATRFKPGQSGNPKGCPKGIGHFRRKCRDYSDEALEYVVSVMRNKSVHVKTRMAAACYIIEHAWGKPKQAVVTENEDGQQRPITFGVFDLTALSREELQALKQRLDEANDSKGKA